MNIGNNTGSDTDRGGKTDNDTSENRAVDNNTTKDNESDVCVVDNESDVDTVENNKSKIDTSEIDTVYGKKLRITCVERKYKIVDQKVSFFIVVRKEFNEERTEKMLHEDMEIKTFLANYEITNIVFPHSSNENIKIKKKKLNEKENFEIGKKEESETTKKRRDIIMNTLKRRELFDSLDLPKEFLVRDYIEAVEKNGIKISNSAMSYDDLRWLAKKGKIEMIKKIDHGVVSYILINKTGNDKIDPHSEEDKDIHHEETVLPSKRSIDRFIS